MKYYESKSTENQLLPDWAFYLTDIFISAVCFAIINYLFSCIHSIYFPVVKHIYQAYAIMLTTTLSAVFFYMFQTFNTSVEYVGLKITQRCIFTVCCISFSLFSIHVFLLAAGKQAIAPSVVLLVYSFILSSCIIAYRFCINYLHSFLFAKKHSVISYTNVRGRQYKNPANDIIFPFAQPDKNVLNQNRSAGTAVKTEIIYVKIS